MAGNDHCSALRSRLGNGQIQDLIQRIDDALQASAFCSVERWIGSGCENVSRRDHIGVPEVDNAVAVRDCRFRMENLNTLSINELAEFIQRLVVNLAWKRGRSRRLATGG